jgi:ClpP class serine protease
VVRHDFSLLHSRVFAGEQPAPVGQDPRISDPLQLDGELVAGRGRAGPGRFGAFRWGWDRTGNLVNHSARIHALAARRAETMNEYRNIVAEEEQTLEGGQILHVFGQGILGKHLSMMDELCSGGLSVDRIQAAVRDAAMDDKVAALCLHLDTPGGIVTGMTETAAQIRALREQKTCAYFSDSLTASCGTWLTSACELGYITPSAEVGAVGVYAAHVAYTEYYKKQGIEVDVITDGSTYKGAGALGTSLTDEQRGLIEAEVKRCSQVFKADVRLGRASARISDDTLQGQCFTGQAAVDAGLADTVVNDLDACLHDLAQAI